MPTKKKSVSTKKKTTAKKKTSVVAKLKKTLKKVVSSSNKAPTKKTATKKAVAKKASPKKAAPKKTTTKKTVVKKTATKKSVTKKAPVKKTVTKKTATKKAVTKKTAVKKTPAKKTTSAQQAAKTKGIENKVVTKEKVKTTNAAAAKKDVTPKTIKKAAAPKRPSSIASSAPEASLTIMGIPAYKENKNEEYMNDKQREHIKSILCAWRQSLMEEVDRTVTHMKDEAANFPDPSDRASQEEEFSLELRTRDRERKLIKKIEDSLENLSDEDFGYCETCGIEIGIRRLEARPTATLCIDCKTLAEIKERQNTGS